MSAEQFILQARAAGKAGVQLWKRLQGPKMTVTMCRILCFFLWRCVSTTHVEGEALTWRHAHDFHTTKRASAVQLNLKKNSDSQVKHAMDALLLETPGGNLESWCKQFAWDVAQIR